MIRTFWGQLATEHLERGGDVLILGTGQNGLNNESDFWILGLSDCCEIVLDCFWTILDRYRPCLQVFIFFCFLTICSFISFFVVFFIIIVCEGRKT